MIIEVTCRYKTNVEYLRQRKIEKERKYISLITEELWQVRASTGKVIAAIISTMGRY